MTNTTYDEKIMKIIEVFGISLRELAAMEQDYPGTVDEIFEDALFYLNEDGEMPTCEELDQLPIKHNPDFETEEIPF